MVSPARAHHLGDHLDDLLPSLSGAPIKPSSHSLSPSVTFCLNLSRQVRFHLVHRCRSGLRNSEAVLPLRSSYRAPTTSSSTFVSSPLATVTIPGVHELSFISLSD
ncbi:hypothetical protein CDL15_Pgr023075 [Punica granatum]|uniref:Uncharacterized protein n=1 Tax=Punica granatum TaxID=22663 RepID=A0A218X3Z8_PUNGR|nr:hypothetical protein CDL15_Pgr023075 [Punica granatum]PKI53892.1 hypothetical protein CRG98_025686 [Punica granatum]